MSHRVVGIVVSVALFHPWTAAAQDPALSEVLIHLIQSEIRLSGPAPGSGFPSHAAHFLPGEDQQLAPFLFNQSIVSQLSTFPIGSSAGGFSYSFDPALGTFTRSTPSFGPSFAERAVTLGRRRASVGASYQHATFHSFEGKRLDTGDIKFYLTHLQETGAFFEGDIVQAALSMRLKTDTFSMFASYGVTDRLDVGVAIPIVHVSLDANVDATILRLATLDSGPTAAIHTFPNGGSTAANRSRNSARSRMTFDQPVGSTKAFGNSSNGSSRATSRASSQPPPSTMRPASSKNTWRVGRCMRIA